MNSEERICLGAVSGAHGVRGAVRIKSFTDQPIDVAAYGPLSDDTGERIFELSGARPVKGGVVARIKGVDDRDQAEALKGTKLSVPRATLPATEDDEFYHADLVGLAAVDGEGADLGRVAAVHNFGAGDLLEIEPPGGAASFMAPFSREVVSEIDLEGRRITVLLPVDEDDKKEASP